MKILIYKDLILNFITQNIENKEYKRQIAKILDNENSVFLFSKKFFLYIREQLGEDYTDEYQRLVTKFSDYGLSVKSREDSENFEEEIIHIFSQSNFKTIVTIALNKPTQEILEAIPNIAILDKQNKPNYHWIAIKLAIFHPNKITLRCYEFSSNNQITQLFKDIFCIPKILTKVSIFDIQCNLDHDKFDYLLSNNIRVSYFTKYSSKEKSQYDRRDEIKENFGNSAGVFLLKRGKKAHGRRIIFENIIITIDEDFWNLQIDESDWNIDIEYNEEVVSNWLNRISNYQRFD